MRARQVAAWRSRLSPDTWAVLLIVGAVLLANAAYLLGIFVARGEQRVDVSDLGNPP